MTEGKKDFRSEGEFNGVIYKGVRYIRLSQWNEELGKDLADWWVREPLDVLTKVRDSHLSATLNGAYNNLIISRGYNPVRERAVRAIRAHATSLLKGVGEEMPERKDCFDRILENLLIRLEDDLLKEVREFNGLPLEPDDNIDLIDLTLQ